MDKADLIAHALARAAREPDKAEEVLAFFCDAVESNRVPDHRILRTPGEGLS